MTPSMDARFLIGGRPFSSRSAYGLVMAEDDSDTHARAIWFSKVPNRVKIFAWLHFRDRLNSKANLHHKHITPNAACPRCAHTSEDALHIFIQCPHAERVWQRLGITPPTCIDNLWACHTPPGLDLCIWSTLLLIILWKIWASRNAMAFHNVGHHCSTTLQLIIEDLTLWTHRLKKPRHKGAAFLCRSYISDAFVINLCNVCTMVTTFEQYIFRWGNSP